MGLTSLLLFFIILVGGLSLLPLLRELRGWTLAPRFFDLGLLVLLALALMGMLLALLRPPYDDAALLLTLSLALGLVWLLRGRFERLWPAISLATIVLWVLTNLDFPRRLYDFTPGWLDGVIGGLWFSLPVFTMILAAGLIGSALQRVELPRGSKIMRIATSLLLIVLFAYTIVWASIWDQTSDGLGGIFYAFFGSLAAFVAGMLLALRLSGPRRAVGNAYAVLVPLLLFAAFTFGGGASYHKLTEDRAAQVARALERYRARQGGYPAALASLAPRDLLLVPRPVILKDEGWCYQSGADFYRLGAFYREYFSTPISLKVFASAGEPSGADWECAARLPAIQSTYGP